jgi:hypothetical protein
MTPTDMLRSCLTDLRDQAHGKTFADAPELYKDIESLKAKIRALQ